jgi:predicted membrane metal-binding protein
MTMVITYRRTGGLLMLLAVAGAVLAATVLTVAVAGTLLIVSATIAAVALLGRAVLPRRWRRRTAPPVTRWAHQTIDATVVNATSSSDTRNFRRLDGGTR